MLRIGLGSMLVALIVLSLLRVAATKVRGEALTLIVVAPVLGMAVVATRPRARRNIVWPLFLFISAVALLATGHAHLAILLFTCAVMALAVPALDAITPSLRPIDPDFLVARARERRKALERAREVHHPADLW